MMKSIVSPSIDLVYDVILLHNDIQLQTDHLVFFVLDDYNKLLEPTLKVSKDAQHATLRVICNALVTLCGAGKQALFMLSGTNYQGVVKSVAGSTLINDDVSLPLNTQTAINEIVRSLSKTKDYRFLETCLKDLAFVKLLASLGGHMRALSVCIDVLRLASPQSMAEHYTYDYQVLFNCISNLLGNSQTSSRT
jgi:hypothetical protein